MRQRDAAIDVPLHGPVEPLRYGVPRQRVADEVVARRRLAGAERAGRPAPTAEQADFARFVDENVRAQKQDGYYAVQVFVRQGDLRPEQWRGLASIITEYGAGRARTTQAQNMVLRWIPGNNVYAVWKALGALNLGESGVATIRDVVSCPGTDSCKLGITSSMGLNRAIGERIDRMNITDALTKQIGDLTKKVTDVTAERDVAVAKCLNTKNSKSR